VRLVLLGAPGSGKGTQGEALASTYGVAHISSGEILRSEVERGTERGRQVAPYLIRGDLVPDDLVLAAVVDAVAKAAAAGGYVLDGFPRNLAQAQRVDAMADGAGITPEAVIYLELPDEVARQRLRGRGEGRQDDEQAAVIENRLRLFHQETESLVAYYRGRGILVVVDASRPPAEVTAVIRAALPVRGARPTVEP
jgi:adenylate kinase